MNTKSKIKDTEGAKVSADKINQIAYILKGIGHSVRLRIIDQLSDGKEMSVGAIQEALDVEQTVLSHHLAKMRDLGLLTTHRDGKSVVYKLKDEQISQIIGCMQKCDIF